MDSIDELIRLDWDIATQHRQCMAKLMAARGIYPGQPPVLFTLKQLGACNQNELARAMRVTPATAAVSLRRLERSGYVRRVQDPSDLRSNRVELTERGEAAAEYADQAIRQVNRCKVSGFSEEQIAAITGLYRQMLANLSALRGQLETHTGEEWSL